MNKGTISLLITLGIAMVFCMAIREVMYGIYFAQLFIVVFLADLYMDFKQHMYDLEKAIDMLKKRIKLD